MSTPVSAKETIPMVNRDLADALRSTSFTKADAVYFLFFVFIMVPVHELLHAVFMVLFGCSIKISFEPLVYPLVVAGYAQGSCALTYFQQKVISLAPEILTGITGIVMVLHGYTKLLDERARLVDTTYKTFSDLGWLESLDKHGLEVMRKNVYKQLNISQEGASRNLIFWGLVFITSVIFTVLIHVLLPISTDWNVLTCAPP